MNTVWLIRMAKWVRNPPSLRQVVLVFGIVLACLALAGIEWLGLWPAALEMDPKVHKGAPRP